MKEDIVDFYGLTITIESGKCRQIPTYVANVNTKNFNLTDQEENSNVHVSIIGYGQAGANSGTLNVKTSTSYSGKHA